MVQTSSEQESKGFLVGYGFALGLWRVMPDQFDHLYL
jgi:hypothetical protein